MLTFSGRARDGTNGVLPVRGDGVKSDVSPAGRLGTAVERTLGGSCRLTCGVPLRLATRGVGFRTAGVSGRGGAGAAGSAGGSGALGASSLRGSAGGSEGGGAASLRGAALPVSYTHLTLPTICSV